MILLFREKRGQKWRYGERYKDPRTGEWHKKYVTLDKPDARLASRLLDQRIAEATKTLGDYALNEVADLYIADLQVSPSTKKRNEYAMCAIVEVLGGTNKIDKLTANFIRAQFKASGKKPGTCNELLGRFKTFIRWAYRNDYISSTECIDKLTMFKDTPHREKIQDKFLNTTELAAVLSAMKDDGNRLITEFLALSGLRIGELIALDDTDVTPDYIHVTKSYSVTTGDLTPGKTLAARRDVYIQPELSDCIQRLRRFMTLRKMASGSSVSYFVINRAGNRLTYYAFNKYFRECCRAVIGRPLTVHSLRHTHASLLMQAGYPLEAIARRLGHENSKVTKEIYLHITDGTRQNDNRMIEKISILSPFCPPENEKGPETAIS